MAFKLELINPALHRKLVPHRIVPVRFARAVSGFADEDAPDMDDRGFLAGTFATGRGPVIGLRAPASGAAAGPTVRVRIIRDRIDAAAQLFATVDNAAVASIEFPVGAALSSTDIPASGTDPARPADSVFVRGISTTEQVTLLKIRFGSATGPVLAEAALRVFPQLTINVQAHVVSINGTAPSVTGAAIIQMFKDVSEIYAPAGVNFLLNGALLNEAVNGFARPGTVTLTNVADQRNVELQTVLRQNPVPNTLNAYFFGHYFDTVSNLLDGVLGIAFSTDDARANPPAGAFPGCQAGITVRDSNDPAEAAHTVAHEIGHSLRLQHYGLGNGDQTRHDIWAHRYLMHNIVGLRTAPPPRETPARADVGYGNYANGTIATGEVLGIKQRAGVPQSEQVNVLRTATNAATFAPV
jgi:hypothetical protein